MPCALLVNPTPLFKVEGNAGLQTPISDGPHPFGFHRPCTRTALAAGYGPIDPSKVEMIKWPKKGFETKKLYRCWCAAQMINAPNKIGIFNTDAHPDVRGPR
jgi:hypothetical protein